MKHVFVTLLIVTAKAPTYTLIPSTFPCLYFLKKLTRFVGVRKQTYSFRPFSTASKVWYYRALSSENQTNYKDDLVEFSS